MLLAASALLRPSAHPIKKKTVDPVEQHRGGVKAAREVGFKAQLDLDLARLIFIAETSAAAKMARLSVRAAKGEHCLATVPHAHSKTAAVVALPQTGGLALPFGRDGQMDGDAFRAYVEQVLVAGLAPGYVVARDHLAARKLHGCVGGIERWCAMIITVAIKMLCAPIIQPYRSRQRSKYISDILPITSRGSGTVHQVAVRLS